MWKNKTPYNFYIRYKQKSKKIYICSHLKGVMNRSITAIVKPTHECNLACKYCYVEDQAEKGRMDQQTLERMTQQLVTLPGIESVNIIWHGGEPLLMGLEFYKEAISIQNALKGQVNIQNSMQSNSTLINEKILDYFEKVGMRIGTSLDGPEEIHNLTRVYPDGRGSFKEVWEGIQLTGERSRRKRCYQKERGGYIGGLGAITILTRKNIDQLEEVYDFFKSNKLSISS
jgi:uncharacterized protein